MGRVSKFKKLKSVDPFNTKAQRLSEAKAVASLPEAFDAARDAKLSYKARQLIHAQNQMKSTLLTLIYIYYLSLKRLSARVSVRLTPSLPYASLPSE